MPGQCAEYQLHNFGFVELGVLLKNHLAVKFFEDLKAVVGSQEPNPSLTKS